MNQCSEPDHGAINAERAESRGLLKRSDAAEIISTHPNDLLGWPKGRRTGKVPKAKMQELERELASVTEQRDRLAEALKEIYNVSSFDYDTMPELARKKYREVVLEMADEALQSLRRTAMSEGWIKLSDRQPELGTLCKWWVLSGQVDDNGEGHYMRVTTTINGQEVGANGFSCKGKGMMISPPEHTYWKGGSDGN